jgi:hypothetical protein
LNKNGQKFSIVFIDKAVTLSDGLNLVMELAGIINIAKALLEGYDKGLKSQLLRGSLIQRDELEFSGIGEGMRWQLRLFHYRLWVADITVDFVNPHIDDSEG